MKYFGKTCVLLVASFILMGATDQAYVNVTKIDVGDQLVVPGISTMFKFCIENSERDTSVLAVRLSIVANVTGNYRQISHCRLLADNKPISTAQPMPVRGAGELFFVVAGGSLLPKNSRQTFAVNCRVTSPLKTGTIAMGFMNERETDPFFAIELKGPNQSDMYATTRARDLIQVKNVK